MQHDSAGSLGGFVADGQAKCQIIIKFVLNLRLKFSRWKEIDDIRNTKNLVVKESHFWKLPSSPFSAFLIIYQNQL